MSVHIHLRAVSAANVPSFFQTAATINWLGAGVSLDTSIKSVELKKSVYGKLRLYERLRLAQLICISLNTRVRHHSNGESVNNV